MKLAEMSGVCDWYVALSYRWGDTPKSEMSKLQQELLQSDMHGMHSDSLPKTFQHAIHFTRQIGVRYLWIDSFCIIQEGEKDWEEQAPKMASVYQGALCTISAAASPNSHGGLYDSEEAKTYKEFEYGGHKLVAYCHMDYKAIEKSALNTRAWVLQEWILSPRLVHFTKHGVFWECISHVASENHDIDFYFTHIQNQPFAREEERKFAVMARAAVAGSFHTWQSLYDTWARLVEDYTSRGMTVPGDKFAALAGLTTAFRGQLQDVYIAGLWRADFHMGLLWSVESYSSIDTIYLDNKRYKAPEWKAAIPGIPSWSWASIDGPVHYNVHREARFVNELLVNDVQVDWETPTKSLGGRITAKGFVRRFHVTYRGAHDCDLCFDTQSGGRSEIKQPRFQTFSKLAQSSQDVLTALEETNGLDAEAKDLPARLLAVREMLLSMPPFIGPIREKIRYFDFRMAEHEVQKPVDFLHGRGSLDRPQIPIEGSQNCEVHAVLVATELRSDTEIGGEVIPYANHVLFLERTHVQGEFRRIGVGVFWARHGYFDRVQSQNLVIC